MNHLARLIASSCITLVAFAGCGKKINPESEGLTCDAKTDVCPVQIALTPAMTTYTNKTVSVQVQVTPGDRAPDHIQLLRNDQTWMTLSAPFTFPWDTTAEPEGTYKIIASASVAGDVVNSNTITIVVDRTAPTVVLHPLNAATNVALSDPVELVFSEAIDPSTVSATSVKLTDGPGNDLGATSSLSTDMTTLTVTIGTPIATFPVTISGVLNGTVKDPAGNALATPPAWSWTAPLWVKLPSFLGSTPSLAKDPSGNPFLAYLQPPVSSSSYPAMAVARYAAGSTWNTTIVPPTTVPVRTVVAAVDQNGAPIVAWSDPAMEHVLVSRLSGSSWAPFGTNADAPGLPGGFNASSIALDSAGNPTVGIADSIGQMGTPGGVVSRWMSTTWQLLTPVGLPTPGPFLAIDSTGAPTALAGQTLQRYVSGSWLTIPLPSSQFAMQTVALDSLDRPVLVFSSGSSAPFALTVSTYANAWTPYLPQVTSTPQPLNEAHVAMAPGDLPVVVWALPNGSNQDLLVARYTPASGTQAAGWNTAFGVVNALGAGVGSAGHAQLIVDGASRPCVAWDEYNSSSNSTSVYVWKSNL
jgi:hypothetical protein